MEPDQHVLYNTGSLSAGNVKPEDTHINDVRKTGSWSADVIQEEPDQYDVIWHWILIRRGLYTNWSGSAWYYTTLDPDQQEMLYQKNRVNMMLYNSWSDQQDIKQEESNTYDVVEHNILIGRRLYTGRSRSARCYITQDPYQQVM